ncbi:MAG: S8 family serine peptidase, partial [Bacteroidota bacterium]
LKLKKDIEAKKEDAANKLMQIQMTAAVFQSSLDAIKNAMEDKEVTLENVKAVDPAGDRNLMIGREILMQALAEQPIGDIGEFQDEVNKQIEAETDYYAKQSTYYDPDFDSREIVGDNYADAYEKGYGNNDVRGPDSQHGTHVAGIIAAVRNNDIGIDGVADNVRIMSIRAVPDGDERDKDVANAIIYAVDNGASVINMSFGKGYSWDKEAVDKAVKYAQKKDVLLVHAAGNSAQDNDTSNNFPNDNYKKRGLFKPKRAKNWLEVGALSWKGGEDAVATFSNYGQGNVDVFAPGVDIYSTTPDQGYEFLSGTSMASPATAGVAAILRSYYPSLSAVQVKEILMTSTTKINRKVKKPGSGEKVNFSDLSQTGGVINAYEAVKLAAQTKGKKKGETPAMRAAINKKNVCIR